MRLRARYNKQIQLASARAPSGCAASALAADLQRVRHPEKRTLNSRSVSQPLLIGTLACVTAIAAIASPALAQSQLREWRLGASPLLTIGGGGQPATEFFGVRGAWRLTDGGIAIANAATSEIRVFDRQGVFVSAFGRKGEGPGEFQRVGWAAHFGDTAVVYDGALRRITTVILGAVPRLQASLAVTASDERGFNIVGRLSDGRWLVRAGSPPDVNRRDVHRPLGFAGLVSPTASGVVEWLAQIPDFPVFVYNPSPAQKMVSVGVPAFPPGMVTVASGRVIWLGDSATDSLMMIDVTTGTRKVVRLSDRPAPLTKDVVDAARTRELATARNQSERDAVELKYSARLLPDRLPAFERLVAGSAGELWVESATGSRVAPMRYVVVSANGILLARVAGAAGFTVTDVGRDYVVGVHRDDDGVETIRLYSLSR